MQNEIRTRLEENYPVAGGVVDYNVWRVSQDKALELELTTIRIILWINTFGAAPFLGAGILAQKMQIGTAMQTFIVALGLPFTTLWRTAFLKVRSANGLPMWRRRTNRI